MDLDDSFFDDDSAVPLKHFDVSRTYSRGYLWAYSPT